MIIEMAAYEDGQRLPGELELDQAFDVCRAGGAFVWIGLHEPTATEFEAVQREFELHDLPVEDAVTAHQRPKLEVYGETLFLVLKTLQTGDEEEVVDIGEIMLFVNPNFVVSVRHGRSTSLAQVRRRVEDEPRILRHGPAGVLYAVLDRVVDDYEPVVESVESALQALEGRVFSADRDNPAATIYRLEREVLEFHRGVVPLGAALDRLLKGPFEMITEEVHTYLVDVQDHYLREAQRIESFRELLTSLLHANLAQVSVRQNEDMRQISAWVAILAVPTMIAGIYGMNFDTMPELRWDLGYPLVLVVMVTICTALFVRFKRVGWL